MDTGHVHSLAEQIHQAGLDEAAEVLAEWLAERPGGTDRSYHDGAEDALCILIQHGATDPRKE